MQPQKKQENQVTRSKTTHGASAAPPAEPEGDGDNTRPQSVPPDDRMGRLGAMLSSFIQAQQVKDEQQERAAQRQDERWPSVQRWLQQLQTLVDAENRPYKTPAEDDSDHQFPKAAEPDTRPELQEDPVLQRSASITPESHRPASSSCSCSPRLVSAWPACLFPAHHGYSPPKMVPYREEGAIERCLTAFERTASANRRPTDSWAVFLVPWLLGKARAARVAMNMKDASIYSKVTQVVVLAEAFHSCSPVPEQLPARWPRPA